MYIAIKKYNRKPLITVDEVVAKLPTDKNSMPIRILEESIQIAEERLKSEFCAEFYEDFRERKNKVVTIPNKAYLESLFPTSVTLNVGEIVNAIEFVDDPDYVDFWNEHYWKILAEMTMYVASPVNYSRFESEGEMENNPRTITGEGSGSSSVELATMKWKMDRMYMDRIAPLIAGANEYLYTYRTAFPKVNCKQSWYRGGDVVYGNSGIVVPRKTAWVTGLYDTKRSTRCYECKDRTDY